MPVAAPEALTHLILEALAKCGQRAVLASGWGRLGAASLPANVHLLDSAPHDRLFPLIDMVVHHGGAGSTAAGLRAGKPTVICPFLGDQPFWGNRVAALGAGPAPLPVKRLSAAALANALSNARDPGVRASAQCVGERIRAEAGVEAAVTFIERHASRRFGSAES